MKKIKLGVIGTGMAWERLHWPALKELNDKYEIRALCNRTRKDAENFASKIGLSLDNVYDNYHHLLRRRDLDAVDVMVPIAENFDVYEDVVKANINLIAEKPLAATLEGAKKLLKLHREHPVNIMIAENYRYNEENNLIKEIIDQGKIGDVIYFINNKYVDFENIMKKNTFAAAEWRQHPDYRGGNFLDAALHDIAGMRHVFGAVDHLYAMGSPQQEEFCPYMSINTQMHFKTGIIGQYSYYTDGKETQRPLIGLRVFGNNGEIYLEEKKCGVINITYKDGGREKINYTPERGYYNELLNFYNALTGKESIAVTPEIEYGDMKMVFDILESIDEQKIVKVDNTETTENIYA
ncbi:MAG: Gfo/Idh/MocA family protein [Halothermotrichaceae bacterium]